MQAVIAPPIIYLVPLLPPRRRCLRLCLTSPGGLDLLGYVAARGKPKAAIATA
jgi:hypothetical protein